MPHSHPPSKMPNHDFALPQDRLLWHIEPEQVGQRLDRYLVSLLGGVSRTGVQQLIAEEAVLVNGRPSKPGYALRLNDEVEALRVIPTSTQRDVKPQPLPL